MSTCLVAVQRGAADPEAPAVYCFHPLGGSAAVYGPLAAHLDRTQAVWGLQSVGLLAGQDPDTSVVAMADRYATEIAADPPAGAVFLGYSLGGVLALETARRLADGGTRPPVLLMLDTDPLYSPAGDAGPWDVLTRQVLNIDVDTGALGGVPITEALERVRAAAAAQTRLPARFSLDRLARMFEVCRANEAAATAHVPETYDRPLHALRSGGAERALDADMWHAFAGDVSVQAVPVDHHGLLGPVGYPYVAAAVRRLLAVSGPTSTYDR